MGFIGRDDELKQLNNLYEGDENKLIVIFGRRRVGKSTLVEKFMEDKSSLHFEGLEKLTTKDQIEQFRIDLRRQTNDSILDSVTFKNWQSVFEYLTQYFTRTTERKILFLDEFQWLAVGRAKLVSIIKSYWDRFWSKQNVMLVLCGSISSYMVKRVINSKSLYGRIGWKLALQPMTPKETYQMLDSKRSKDEILQYSMIFGGIPKYLNEIKKNRSFEQNINQILFVKNAILIDEYQKIFYSQFKEPKLYEEISRLLNERPMSLNDIAKKLKITSGGSLGTYLSNLEKAAFITSYIPYDKGLNSKLKKYKLSDEFLRFYFKYIEPNLKRIEVNASRDLFDLLVKPVWKPWLGLAFETYCLKHTFHLSELMGFDDKVLDWGPIFKQGDTHFQVDLAYRRLDNVITICEIRYHSGPIDVSILADMKKKSEHIHAPRGYTVEYALISRFGPDESLRKLNYFHHYLTVEDFFT
jgi:hypothetical protein